MVHPLPATPTRGLHSFLHASSNILPTKSLCIQSGKFVWVLYVDATCINYNGNVFDATLLAMVAALKNGTWLASRLLTQLIAPRSQFACQRPRITKRQTTLHVQGRPENPYPYQEPPYLRHSGYLTRTYPFKGRINSGI